MRGLAAVFLLVSATAAGAQASRNGPEWGGKDHQPTQAEVVRRETRAGVRAPVGQVRQDNRTVEQLDRQLLRNEAVDPPAPARPSLR